MPELPEVEQFRQILLPLVSKTSTLRLTSVSDNPPRGFITKDEIESLSGQCFCTDVLRRGKQLCLVLKRTHDKSTVYLYLHMGMTGGVSSPTMSCTWGHKYMKDAKEFPPRYTYLTFETDDYQAAFSDPRKFGKCYLSDNLTALNELAHDAMTCCDHATIETQILPRLTSQSTGIKALILDQKRVVAGVGNWVADEVLYQIGMHPDQSCLTDDQASLLFSTLQKVLKIAVECLKADQPYPDDWLFHYRWTKKKAGKDAKGRSLTFLTSGGRTSAIVASVQKLYKGRGTKTEKLDQIDTSVAEGTLTKKRKATPKTSETFSSSKRDSERSNSIVSDKKTKTSVSTTADVPPRRRSPRRYVTPLGE